MTELLDNSKDLTDYHEKIAKAAVVNADLQEATEKEQHARKKAQFNLNEVLKEYQESLKPQTWETYSYGLKRFLNSFDHVLDVKARDADNYLVALSKERSPSTVRLHVAAISGLYNLIIRYDYLRFNPFSGTKKVPKMETVREQTAPREDEIETILAGIKTDHTYVATLVMINTGLRVAEIQKIKLNGDVYTTIVKGGRTVTGHFPDKCRAPIEARGYDLSQEQPFANLKKKTIQNDLARYMGALEEAGKIEYRYHAHSFRHYFAVQIYKRTTDLYKVCRLLNHKSITATEKYLKSIGLIKSE